MQDYNYITIQGFMINKLHLSGNELFCFALIYGFSQDGNSVFSGTASYIAQWLGIDKRNVYPILTKLTEKGYIEKVEKVVNNIKLCDYKIASRVMMIHQGGGDASIIGGDVSSGGGDVSSHHNINDNNINIKEKEKEKENEVEIVDGKITNKKNYFSQNDITKIINSFSKNFKPVDAIVGVVESEDGTKHEGICVKNQGLLEFIKYRFDRQITKKASDWAIDHTAGYVYNAKSLLKLLCKFQADVEPSISFNMVQNEYVDFCCKKNEEKNKKVIDE